MNCHHFVFFVVFVILVNDISGQLLDTYRGRVAFQRGLVGNIRSIEPNALLSRVYRPSRRPTVRRVRITKRNNRMLHWILENCSGRACGGPGGEWCGDNRKCVYLPAQPLGRCCRKDAKYQTTL